jgi:hypothetical protein
MGLAVLVACRAVLLFRGGWSHEEFEQMARALCCRWEASDHGAARIASSYTPNKEPQTNHMVPLNHDKSVLMKSGSRPRGECLEKVASVFIDFPEVDMKSR